MKRLPLTYIVVGVLAWLLIHILGCGSGASSPQEKRPTSSTAVQLPDGLKALDIKSIKSALPRRWLMSDPRVVPAPYGFRGEGKDGIKIVFTGPEYLKAPTRMKVGEGNESFTLWFMPADYTAAGPAQTQSNALLLGGNAYYKVFYYVRTISVPTWTTWRQDLMTVCSLSSIVLAEDLSFASVDLNKLPEVLPEGWYVSSVCTIASPLGWEKCKCGNGLIVGVSRAPYSYDLNPSKSGGMRVHRPQFAFCIMPSDFSGKSANGAVFAKGTLDISGPQSQKAMLILEKVMTVHGCHFFYGETYFSEWENPPKIFSKVLRKGKGC